MTKEDISYIFPPEWHEQYCVQLTWPHAGTDWKPYLEDIVATCVEMVSAISRYESVVIATQDVGATRLRLEQSLDAGQMSRVHLFACRNDDTWARDHGFITLLPVEEGEPLLLDFRFNGWGEKFCADLDNVVSRTLFAAGAFCGRVEDHNDFVLEGGAIESDGRGTVFTTSGCLLAPHRNQPLDRDAIEQRLKAMLRAKRIVWLDYGQLIGDDTDGHIDTIVRTAPYDTLVYVGSGDEDDPQHDDFCALERQLRTLRTLDGKPYRLLRLPMPRPIYDGDDRLPATYANFLVINGAVLVPQYDQPDLDREAMLVVKEAFPGRQMIGIDARTIIRQHGSVHCMTMQFPTECVPD